jgi:hypothetical protein
MVLPKGYYHFLVPQLLHDDTFRRLCRGRDLLAAEYQSRVLLEQAAREACLSEFHFHRLSVPLSARPRMIFSLAFAWTAPDRCSLLSAA